MVVIEGMKCRAMVLTADACLVDKDLLRIDLECAVYSYKHGLCWRFKNRIFRELNHPQGCEFTSFLEKNQIAFDDYKNLAGLVFDAIIGHFPYRERSYTYLRPTELIARPLRD